MLEYYAEIRCVHIGAVSISGFVFFVRGLGLLLHAHWPRHIVLRYTSYLVDCILLMAALMLMTIIRQYPLADAWLSVKIVLLGVYITLGILCFRAQEQKQRIRYWLTAITVFALIISVARSHHPLGFIKILIE